MEDDHIQHLIMRYLSKEASAIEEGELLDWVAKDPSNRQYFFELKEIWDNGQLSESEFDINRGFNRLNNAIDESEVKGRRLLWRKLAASIAILTVVSFTVYFFSQSSPPQASSVVYEEHIMKAGQRATFTLEDGTTIILNANSSLRFPTRFDRDKREVFLSGEAFFQVTRDLSRPFLVHAGHLTTQVLGTSFNIRLTKGSATVSVASGKVRVTDGNVFELVYPKEKIVYVDGEKSMVKVQTNLEDELAWKDNTIIFRDAPLSQAAIKLHEFYGHSVQFENEMQKKCLITGKFSNKPVQVVLNAISFSTGIQYRITGNTIIFYGPGCE